MKRHCLWNKLDFIRAILIFWLFSSSALSSCSRHSWLANLFDFAFSSGSILIFSVAFSFHMSIGLWYESSLNWLKMLDKSTKYYTNLIWHTQKIINPNGMNVQHRDTRTHSRKQWTNANEIHRMHKFISVKFQRPSRRRQCLSVHLLIFEVPIVRGSTLSTHFLFIIFLLPFWYYQVNHKNFESFVEWHILLMGTKVLTNSWRFRKTQDFFSDFVTII